MSDEVYERARRWLEAVVALCADSMSDARTPEGAEAVRHPLAKPLAECRAGDAECRSCLVEPLLAQYRARRTQQSKKCHGASEATETFLKQQVWNAMLDAVGAFELFRHRLCYWGFVIDRPMPSHSNVPYMGGWMRTQVRRTWLRRGFPVWYQEQYPALSGSAFLEDAYSRLCINLQPKLRQCESYLFGYLATVIRRECHDHIVSIVGKTTASRPAADQPAASAVGIGDGMGGSEESLAWLEAAAASEAFAQRDLIRRAIARSRELDPPPKLQTLFVERFYFLGQSVDDLAHEFHLTNGNVSVIKRRGVLRVTASVLVLDPSSRWILARMSDSAIRETMRLDPSVVDVFPPDLRERMSEGRE